MNAMKPSQWLALGVVVAFCLYAIYTHLQYFGNVSFLGAILLLEIVIAGIWKFSERFFIILMIAFLWAGMNVPLEGAWTAGRWVVLAVGAFAGFIVWMKSPRSQFKTIHLIAFFCVGAAFVSASVSPFLQLAASKALSLLLLFIYCCTGVRLALLGREDRFFRGLLWACEIAVYATAVCYLGLGIAIWGNPNSLGVAMSVGLFPPLLWGWMTSTAPTAKTRRLVALLLCVYLVLYSMARAGIVSVFLVTLILCYSLREYRLLIKIAGLVLAYIAITGVISPSSLNDRLSFARDAILYKGHKEEGFLGSRKTPWQRTVSSIKEHPWFGTGYGTSPSGEDPGFGAGEFSSSAETSREHGSSYMTIAEWVGLLGLLPFIALLGLTAWNVWQVCLWMRHTGNSLHYSIPLAMVVLSGLIHANFEDWLFAVGAYPCIYFWSLAFLLADLVPAVEVVPTNVFLRRARPSPNFGAPVPNR